MADEDEINLDDNGSSSSDKKGGLGGIFPSLLKWIIIGLAAVIVIVVVVVITVKITGKNSTTVTAIPASLSLRVFYGCGEPHKRVLRVWHKCLSTPLGE